MTGPNKTRYLNFMYNIGDALISVVRASPMQETHLDFFIIFLWSRSAMSFIRNSCKILFQCKKS